jgi:hypothetical protein
VEVHDGVAAASDTSSEGILDVVGHTFVDADIDVDAAEALAGRVDAEQNTASGQEKAASTDLDDSCTEVAAEASARSPRWGTLTWHAMEVAHSSEQSPQDSLGRSRCDTSALAAEAYSQHGNAGDDAYAAEAWVAVGPAHSHHSKLVKAIDIPDA